jgi:hypothetical protein
MGQVSQIEDIQERYDEALQNGGIKQARRDRPQIGRTSDPPLRHIQASPEAMARYAAKRKAEKQSQDRWRQQQNMLWLWECNTVLIGWKAHPIDPSQPMLWPPEPPKKRTMN